MVAVYDEHELTALHFSPDPGDAEPASRARSSLVRDLARQLDRYWTGHLRRFDVPLRLTGTPFQLDVWGALRHLPYGETTSYAALARAIGRPSAVRAVGRANGANPVAILVPCHRVIGSDGSLTGYAGGIERKRSLLQLESNGLEGSGDALENGAVAAHP
jgi:methylated-DNA-[protein]-cysteine S-methyltransferase